MLFLPISKVAASAALLVLIFLIFLPPYNFPKSLFTKNRHIWALASMLIILSLSLLYSANWQEGWKLIYQHNAFLLIPLVFVLNKKVVAKKGKILLLLFIIGVLFNTLVTVSFYFLPDELAANTVTNLGFLKPYIGKAKHFNYGLYSPFMERIQLSNMMALAVFCCMYLFAIRYKRLLVSTLIIVLVFGSLFIGGRAGQLGMFIGACVFLIIALFNYLYPKWKRKFGKKHAFFFASGLVLLLVLSPYVLYKGFPPVSKRYGQLQWELNEYYNGIERDYKHLTTVRRIVSWQNSWEIVKKNPIFGVGIGDYYAEMEQQYKQQGSLGLPVDLHNQYLYYWASTGIIGLLVFVSIMLLWLYKLNSKKQAIYLFACAFLSCYGLVFIVDATLQFQIDIMAFSTFFSLIPFLNGK